MYNLAKQIKDADRRDVFINVSTRKKINPAIVEKDFWVCLVLDYLFSKSEWKDKIVFKGGTSLSKAYGLIERFSEDIDLIIDWRELGYKINEPYFNRSNTQQQKFILDAKMRLFDWTKNIFMPSFRSILQSELERDLDIYIDESDPGTVCFKYPASFENNSILNVIRLEFGALSAWNPNEEMIIKSYVAEIYPDILTIKNIKVLTSLPEKTFWEKATILHQEAFRSKDSSVPSRYSRHYYDLFCMSRTNVKCRALNNLYLLEEVSNFKSLFYPRNWAHYDLAKRGTLRLYPPDYSIEQLRKDYMKMSEMIYGDHPSFDELLEHIKKLEIEINK